MECRSPEVHRRIQRRRTKAPCQAIVFLHQKLGAIQFENNVQKVRIDVLPWSCEGDLKDISAITKADHSCSICCSDQQHMIHIPYSLISH